MRTYDMQRARALMGLGALSDSARQELDITRGHIWDTLTEATGLLRGSAVSAADTSAFDARVAQLRDDIDAQYMLIDQGKAEDISTIAAEVRQLGARADNLLSEARALVAQNASSHSRGYAIALGVGVLATLLAAVTLTAKERA